MNKNIQYLAMDVDGTLTDGKIYMGENGEVMKAFGIKDGYAIKNMLPEHHIIPVIITGRESKIVENRCKELDITEIYQNVNDKRAFLEGVTRDFKTVAYIGDDFADLEVCEAIKKAGGIVGTPADGINEIKIFADFISTKKGGDGAVREFVEYIINNS